MKYKPNDCIIYRFMDELFYAVVIEQADELMQSDKLVNIQTYFSFFAIYDDGSIGLSPPALLDIKYIKGKVLPNKTKQELIDMYPEYLL